MDANAVWGHAVAIENWEPKGIAGPPVRIECEVFVDPARPGSKLTGWLYDFVPILSISRT